MKIIDARVRLPQERRATKEYAAPARQTEAYDRVLSLRDKVNSGSLDNLLSGMKEQGIAHAVMHAESEGGEDADLLNEALAKVLVEHPGTFKGVGCIGIADQTPGQMAAQAVRAEGLGMIGLSLQPAFFGVDIDDRVLYPVYARAEELGLIVALHTGINYSRMHPMRHEHPQMLDQVACDFPDLKLIASHAGWPWSAEFAAVARRHPTVFMEFGGLAPKYVARSGSGWDPMFTMMPNVLREQMLYGTDWPTMDQGRALSEWRESGLNDEALQALFHDNAAKLFGFEPSTPR
jgi:uncharacterized protein